MSRRILAVAVAAMIAAAAGAATPIAAAESARTVVERFHESLIAVMKAADTLGVMGRYERLTDPVTRAFDLERMIRVATGPFWRKAEADQRDRLLAAFTRMSVGTYASRFKGYSGEAFETVAERPGPQNTILVATRIVPADDAPVDITYVMKTRDGSWRIVDILLDNSVSELAVRRSEYRRVLDKEGADGLIAILDRKFTELTGER